MPIYAYRCSSCGHAKDVLRKISDPPLSTCPACGAETFDKQLTAAGFQLKGSGWYVTDFKGGSGAGTSAPAVAGSAGDAGGDKGGGDKSGGGSAPAAGSGDAGSSSAPPSSAAASCGGSCACH